MGVPASRLVFLDVMIQGPGSAAPRISASSVVSSRKGERMKAQPLQSLGLRLNTLLWLPGCWRELVSRLHVSAGEAGPGGARMSRCFPGTTPSFGR